MIPFRPLLLLALFCALRAFATDLPLTQDFELTSGGFTPSSATSWKWGHPTAGPGSAHSGTQVWGTNLTSASYSNSEDAILTSSAYDLSGFAGQSIVVHWWQWLENEEGFDDARVEVSRDGGGTWETILGPRSGVVDAVWTQHTVVLDPSYATALFHVRFRLISDDFPSSGGFFIDDLRLSAAALTEAAPLQDFELGNGGYVASGPNSSWAYGTPVSAPGAAFSGSKAWVTNLDGFYNANEDSALTSPDMDLSASAGQQLIVSWWQFFDTEDRFDLGTVEVSNDSGATWHAVSPGETLSGVVSASWMRRQAFVDASFATAGFRLRFRLTTDESQQFDGWAIDNVAVYATTGLLPSTGSFTKALPQNFQVKFSQAEFVSHFTDPDGGDLTGIVINSLPANGTLKLGGVDVVAGQSILLSGLATLTYDPVTDAAGLETFLWSSSNFFGSSASGTVTLNILAPTPLVVIAIDPQPQTVNPGSPVTFSVTAVSSLPLTYQWRKNTVPIGTATASTFTIAAAAEGDEDNYDAVVSNNGGSSATSAAASLSVNDPVHFIQQPASTFVLEGGNITLTVSAAGTGRLDYQWLKNDQPIPDATFASFSIVDAKASDDAAYRCAVTNVAGSKSTDPAQLTVRLKPHFVVGPISRGVPVKGGVTFSVLVEGFGPFTYQWIKDGVDIPGATGATLVVKNLIKTNAGNYSVRVSNGVAAAESNPAGLQVFVWTEVGGTFQDLLAQQTPVVVNDNPFPGRLTVTSTRGSLFTAVLQYRGHTYRFLGAFNSELHSRKLISRPLQPPLTVDLQLDTATLVLSASVKHDEAGVAYRSDAAIPRHSYTPKAHPAPQKGRYTVLLQPTSDIAPAYLFATVSPAGQMIVAGRLADGTNLLSAAFVQSTSRAPIYQSLYGVRFPTAGELSGRLTLPVSDVAAEVGGEFAWRKPVQKIAGILPGPRLEPLGATGSRYVAPGLNKTVIALPQDKDLLDLRIAGLTPGLELKRWVRLTPKNLFYGDPTSGEKIGFTLARTTGAIRGSYTDPLTKKKYAFLGVSLQSQGMFGGMLMHEAVPATFTMLPLVP